MNVQAILLLTIILDDLSKDSSTIISSKDNHQGYFSTLRLLESTFTRIWPHLGHKISHNCDDSDDLCAK